MGKYQIALFRGAKQLDGPLYWAEDRQDKLDRLLMMFGELRYPHDNLHIRLTSDEREITIIHAESIYGFGGNDDCLDGTDYELRSMDELFGMSVYYDIGTLVDMIDNAIRNHK